MPQGKIFVLLLWLYAPLIVLNFVPWLMLLKLSAFNLHLSSHFRPAHISRKISAALYFFLAFQGTSSFEDEHEIWERYELGKGNPNWIIPWITSNQNIFLEFYLPKLWHLVDEDGIFKAGLASDWIRILNKMHSIDSELKSLHRNFLVPKWN